MIQRIYILIAACALLSIGCNKNNTNFLFEVESIASASILAGLNTVETHYIELLDIPSSLTSQLESESVSIDQINRILPATFEIVSLDAIPLSFIENMSVLMRSENHPDALEIAYLEFVPFNTERRLRLLPTLIDVKDFLADGTFTLILRFRIRSFIPQTVDTRIDMTFQAE